MVPKIFISSTVADLAHLRESLREAVKELSYEAVMSEYGDVGYLPRASAEESCYLTVGDCQICVLIVGKRYGSLGQNGLSVTQNEFKEAREKKLPIISLVDSEVLAFKRVNDANADAKNSNLTYPGMDEPLKTFSFVQELREYPSNNGFLEFKSAAEARYHFKTQLAHIFGDMLRNRYDPTREGIRDVLAELKDLKQRIVVKDNIDNSKKFLKAMRFILNDANNMYRNLCEAVYGDLDKAVAEMMNAESFQDAIEKQGYQVEISSNDDFMARWNQRTEEERKGVIAGHGGSVGAFGSSFFEIYQDKRILIGRNAKSYFELEHSNLCKAAEGKLVP